MCLDFQPPLAPAWYWSLLGSLWVEKFQTWHFCSEFEIMNIIRAVITNAVDQKNLAGVASVHRDQLANKDLVRAPPDRKHSVTSIDLQNKKM